MSLSVRHPKGHSVRAVSYLRLHRDQGRDQSPEKLTSYELKNHRGRWCRKYQVLLPFYQKSVTDDNVSAHSQHSQRKEHTGGVWWRKGPSQLGILGYGGEGCGKQDWFPWTPDSGVRRCSLHRAKPPGLSSLERKGQITGSRAWASSSLPNPTPLRPGWQRSSQQSWGCD